MLSDSGRLEGTLTSISSEKELLATSLQQEANYNKQLEQEKVWPSFQQCCRSNILQCSAYSYLNLTLRTTAAALAMSPMFSPPFLLFPPPLYTQEVLELHLHETQQCLEVTQAELQRLKESQVSEIDVRCREIDRMKSQLQQELGGLAEEREGLERELRGAREELMRTRAENER